MGTSWSTPFGSVSPPHVVVSGLGLFKALLAWYSCYWCYLLLSGVTGVTPKKCAFLQVVDPFGDNLCGENHNLWVNHIAVTTRCSDDFMGKRSCAQANCLYMACWACRDHKMMWFPRIHMPFYQVFSLRIRSCGLNRTFSQLCKSKTHNYGFMLICGHEDN